MVRAEGGEARGGGLAPAENEREKTFTQGFFGSGGDIAAGFGNLLQILGAFFAHRHFFRLLDGDIADGFNLQAELLDAALSALAAQRAWPHFHTPAPLPEPHGHPPLPHYFRHLTPPPCC